ncbi:hypothetical protein [Deinococcus sp.]|uniref:hypothetical protein n=1 Tax=Deinococcus sp. TaxID=47478 RepID=UPI003C7C48F9
MTSIPERPRPSVWLPDFGMNEASIASTHRGSSAPHWTSIWTRVRCNFNHGSGRWNPLRSVLSLQPLQRLELLALTRPGIASQTDSRACRKRV